MTNLSQFSEDETIAMSKTPLGSRIDGIRKTLQSVTLQHYESARTAETEETLDGWYSHLLQRDAILSLIEWLRAHPIARRLQSRVSSGTVAGELAFVFSRLDSDKCDLQLFSPLRTLVEQEARDVDIWKAVLDLLSSFEHPRERSYRRHSKAWNK